MVSGPGEDRLGESPNASVSRLKKETGFSPTHSVALNAGGDSYCTCSVHLVFVDHVVTTWQEER